MITLKLFGQERVKMNLAILEKIKEVAEKWMKSGQTDAIMQESFRRNFAQQGRPKWSKLAERTIKEREKKGFGKGPILQRTGNLADEINSLKGELKNTFGGVVQSWGEKQLRSDERVKFRAHQLGKGRTGQSLPKRAMIGFQKEDANNLVRSLNNWIRRQYR